MKNRAGGSSRDGDGPCLKFSSPIRSANPGIDGLPGPERPVSSWTSRSKLSLEDLKKAVADVDAIIVRSETKITADVLAAAKKVKIVGRAGVGVDNIDVGAASRQGVIVVNVPGGNTISAAEHTVAMLLALSRNIPQANESLKAGEWKRSKFTGTEVQGKVLGLIGMGRIGREVAKRCQSFGMSVIGFDPYTSEEYAKNFNIKLSTLEEIYAQADYITVHVPLNDTHAPYVQRRNARRNLSPACA